MGVDADVDDATTEPGGDDGAPEVATRLGRVETALGEIREFLTGGVGNAATEQDDDTDTDDGEEVTDDAATTPTLRSQRAQELDIEARVRAELGRVKRDEEIDTTLAELKDKVAEKPPAKQSKLSRFMFGDVNR